MYNTSNQGPLQMYGMLFLCQTNILCQYESGELNKMPKSTGYSLDMLQQILSDQVEVLGRAEVEDISYISNSSSKKTGTALT